MQEKYESEQRLFTLVFDQSFNQYENKTCLSPTTIIFKDDVLYQTFLKYLNSSNIVAVRDGVAQQSLANYCIAESNLEKKAITMKSCFGKENILGKFFLETDLDWPKEFYEADTDRNSKYKQPIILVGSSDGKYGKGVPTIYLDRQNTVTIPDSAMQSMNSYHQRIIKTIKKIAPFIWQERRTNPKLGFFARLPDDYLTKELAPYLASLPEGVAAVKMAEEMTKAKILHDKKWPFSFEAAEINFSQLDGTNVLITPTDNFSNWFNELKLKEAIEFAGYSVYKINDNTIAINRGDGTPGIQIRKEGKMFRACNNQTADDVDKSLSAEHRKSVRTQHLENVLTDLHEGLAPRYTKASRCSMQ